MDVREKNTLGGEGTRQIPEGKKERESWKRGKSMNISKVGHIRKHIVSRVAFKGHCGNNYKLTGENKSEFRKVTIKGNRYLIISGK